MNEFTRGLIIGVVFGLVGAVIYQVFKHLIQRRKPVKDKPFLGFVFPTEQEAYEILEYLHDLVDRYGAVSLADLYQLMDITSHYQDTKIGWDDLTAAKVLDVMYGHELRLPETKVLD